MSTALNSSTATICTSVPGESVEKMVSLGVTRFVEVGSGKVLSGLVKRIAPDAVTLNLETPEDVEGFLA